MKNLLWDIFMDKSFNSQKPKNLKDLVILTCINFSYQCMHWLFKHNFRMYHTFAAGSWSMFSTRWADSAAESANTFLMVTVMW